ncbi:MAG: 50S ribosomal protein L4 [Bdellovibrionaceae bacterium]|nr:50S ribosomal protein L4 [Pseudobdellovibrionaceae bacterium]
MWWFARPSKNHIPPRRPRSHERQGPRPGRRGIRVRRQNDRQRLGTQALHEVVVGYRANRRSGTHQTKTKGTVRGTGKKPYRQKGTGMARAGYFSSPVRTGGGVAHGPHPRDYSKILPRKVRQLALKKALSEAARKGKLFSGSAPPWSPPRPRASLPGCATTNSASRCSSSPARPTKTSSFPCATCRRSAWPRPPMSMPSRSSCRARCWSAKMPCPSWPKG